MSKSPMLAERESLHHWPEALRFPLYASPKLDGIRCVVSGGSAVSRSFTPIKNNVIRGLLSLPALEGIDGELISGPVSAENVFNTTTRAVMTIKGDPQFEYHIFDDFSNPLLPYNQRQVKLCERMTTLVGALSMIRYVEPKRVESWDELATYEDEVLGQGYEGVITRAHDGEYKFGRSSKTHQGMLKLKRFTDSEAEIIGFEELMRNENVDVRDNLGHAKRSKAQAGLVPGGTLGKLQARDLLSGVEFQIGMFKGLTSEDKQEIWDKRESYLGRIVRYSFLAHGVVDLPRHSKFTGFRDASDL